MSCTICLQQVAVINLLAFPTYSNHLVGPLYKQEETTLSCY